MRSGQFLGNDLELDEDAWETLAVLSYRDNRLDTDSVPSSSFILLELCQDPTG